MNKSLLILVSLFISTSSLAAAPTLFELPKDISFTGSVVTPAPVWKWRVHSTASSWAKDWNIDADSGIKNSDGTTTFSYDSINITRNSFIQGMMSAPSSSGRADIVPIVSLSIEGGSLELNGNTIEQTSVIIPAIGHTGSGTTVYGKLMFTVESAYSVFYKKTDNTKKYFSESYNGSIGWAGNSILIENKPADYADGRSPEYVRRDVNYKITDVIRGTLEPNAFDILASFTTHLSHFNGIWTEIPYTWTATLVAHVRVP